MKYGKTDIDKYCNRAKRCREDWRVDSCDNCHRLFICDIQEKIDNELERLLNIK